MVSRVAALRDLPEGAFVATLPTGRHSYGCGRAARGNGALELAWPRHTVGVGVVALCPRTYARGVIGTGLAGHALTLTSSTDAEGPSLLRRCSSPLSTVLRPSRTPAVHAPLSPWAYSSALAATTAEQPGLPSSALLLAQVLRPVPRRTLSRASVLAREMLPSPGSERLGFRIVPLSRLQASLHVAARVLASFPRRRAPLKAFDGRLRPSGSLPLSPRSRYPAHRRLPGRDSHPLEECREQRRPNVSAFAYVSAHHRP